MKHSGFTMIEMITTLIIIGVLAAIAAPRFFTQQAYSDRGFYDQTLAITRFAQKSAIAIRRNVCVNIAPPSISVTYASASSPLVSPPLPCTSAAVSGAPCDTNLPSPVGGSPFTITAPSGTTLSPATTITFLGLGIVSAASTTTTIAVSSRTITVETCTGYVH
ncbi:MAG TPA: prepilin-type N-terminal cleavage/methylation domain-containing protein [Burkholderiales bacterium]|nr:prepilin-type N-terminal cleavage/methylation domain-containing protein [Burkholderiales bacterium]